MRALLRELDLMQKNVARLGKCRSGEGIGESENRLLVWLQLWCGWHQNLKEHSVANIQVTGWDPKRRSPRRGCGQLLLLCRPHLHSQASGGGAAAGVRTRDRTRCCRDGDQFDSAHCFILPPRPLASKGFCFISSFQVSGKFFCGQP